MEMLTSLVLGATLVHLSVIPVITYTRLRPRNGLFVLKANGCFENQSMTRQLHQKTCVLLMVCIFEPPREKTNNVVSDQVRHKPVCTVIEKG